MTLRAPAGVGTFYPADRDRLASEVDSLLAAARPPALDGAPRAIVVPHAAYAYSGAVAATGYAAVTDGVRRVVVIGPAHFVPLRGVALPEAAAFATPLGDVAVDAQMREAVAQHAVTDAAPHAPEHSLEVQLPFVRRRFGEIPVLPLVCGEAASREVADALESVWHADTLVVCSTDLSHYLPDAIARERDRRTAVAVCALDPVAIGRRDACGAHPLRGLLEAGRRRGLSASLLDLRTSADAGGDADRVVGYGAFALT